jgi:hypothetical protein
VYDERLLGPELPQSLGHRPDVVAVEDADELPPGPGRVGQGTKQVKDGSKGNSARTGTTWRIAGW